MAFLILLLVPVLISGVGFFFSSSITWKEFLLQMAAQALIAGASIWVVYHQSTSDTEILNGRVTDKKQVWVHCSHSYSCNCVKHESCSGVGKDRTCSETEVCQTCYDHTNDWDWTVYSSIGYELDIERVDRRGSNEPPRWTAVRIGEPFSTTHGYENFVKGAPGTLLKRQGLTEKFAKALPEYPIDVHDYYRADRLVLINGASVPDRHLWNQQLSEINADLGARRQANLIVVLARNLPQEYVYALEEKWTLGKKNDVILVIGVDSGMVPQWAYVMAWTHQQLIRVSLRDAIMDLPVISREPVLEIFRREVATKFVRQPMKDFEYLKSSIVPTTSQWLWSMLFGLLSALGLSYFFHRNDVL